MNVGKMLLAQVMEYVPWKTFGRIIDHHSGDAGVSTLDCADLTLHAFECAESARLAD
jgi:hypothetical protein